MRCATGVGDSYGEEGVVLGERMLVVGVVVMSICSLWLDGWLLESRVLRDTS